MIGEERKREKKQRIFTQNIIDICVFEKKIVSLPRFINRFTMKKNIALFSILTMVAIIMASCFTPSPSEVEFKEADLLGLWQENGTETYIRFTNEQDDKGEYKYGREWDESEDIFESDLKPYGNGWFKYKLVKSDLTEIHLMDNGGADIPKVYQVLKLTAGELQYKDDFGTTHTFDKVLEQ